MEEYSEKEKENSQSDAFNNVQDPTKDESENEDDGNQTQDQKNRNDGNNKEEEEEEEEAEEIYVVDEILNHRVRYKKLQFYLKWEGWTDEDNTWEDFENLNCPDKITEYRDKILSESDFDVFSLMSSYQRDLVKEMFKDNPSVYENAKFKQLKTEMDPKKSKYAHRNKTEKVKKKPIKKNKKKDKKDKVKDKVKDKDKEPKKVSKIPDFEVISPDFQTGNPLLRFEGVLIKNGEIFYKIKRRKMPSEEISSKVLKETYPDRLASYLNELFTGNEI